MMSLFYYLSVWMLLSVFFHVFYQPAGTADGWTRCALSFLNKINQNKPDTMEEAVYLFILMSHWSGSSCSLNMFSDWVFPSMFLSDNSDDVDPSAAVSKDGQPAAPESGQFTCWILVHRTQNFILFFTDFWSISEKLKLVMFVSAHPELYVRFYWTSQRSVKWCSRNVE